MKIIILLFCLLIPTFGADITIRPGASASLVANQLKEKDLISNAKLFYFYLRANKLSTKIHTGTYNIPQNASFKEIADIITGKVQQLTKLTIPEGFTINEIILELKKKKIISDVSEFNRFLANKANQPINKYLTNVPLQSFEGIFFPDTYFFSKNMSNEQVYNVFLKRFNTVFLPLYGNAKQPKLSFYDTLKLASIIEKEAGTQKEMTLISGVFHNRLKKRMHLASCPTVGYAMGQPRKKSLTYKDLKYKSPFNTYRNLGLPPTPIAAPGKNAFLAALNPQKTKYLYFVSKNDGSGEHVFSTTLKDHLRHQKRIIATTTN
ncbi:MAG: endolytic transglycosylase MltG [Candidatus Marinamargulisbacteria bacterium]